MPAKKKHPAPRSKKGSSRTIASTKKRPRFKRPTPKGPKHVEGRSAIVGADERLQDKILFAHEMRGRGFFLHEIAREAEKEFGLANPPSQSTISDWLAMWNHDFFEKLMKLKERLRIDQFNQLEQMKRKWLPLATMNQMPLTRFIKVDGELVPVMDENAFDEQVKANSEVLKIMARQAKLMDLDLSSAVTDEDQGGKSLKDLHIWIIDRLNESVDGAKPAEARVIDKLELTSGDIDEL